ncbi:MAG TPA: hypothetical protein VMR50_11345 [Myxococcota bacterium]|nr:hypothetical protein [Myxococcota bacterium]
MKYTPPMNPQRFRELAEELAAGDPELCQRLRRAEAAALALRDRVSEAVETFRKRAAELGASQLCDVAVTPVELDEKHVDAMSFRVTRGRWQLLCVAVASGPGKFRVVGPFQRGKTEGPCGNAGLAGPELESLVEERLAALLREAAGA